MGMLVLTRRKGERIFVGKDIIVTLMELQGGKARIGIEAPPDVDIYREEVKLRYEREGYAAKSNQADADRPREGGSPDTNGEIGG